MEHWKSQQHQHQHQQCQSHLSTQSILHNAHIATATTAIAAASNIGLALSVSPKVTRTHTHTDSHSHTHIHTVEAGKESQSESECEAECVDRGAEKKVSGCESDSDWNDPSSSWDVDFDSVLRGYQEEVLHAAKQEGNVIAFLPTGAGKTRISWELCKDIFIKFADKWRSLFREDLKDEQHQTHQHQHAYHTHSETGRDTQRQTVTCRECKESAASLCEHLRSDIERERPRIVFLAPTVSLVVQQADVFRKHIAKMRNELHAMAARKRTASQQQSCSNAQRGLSEGASSSCSANVDLASLSAISAFSHWNGELANFFFDLHVKEYVGMGDESLWQLRRKLDSHADDIQNNSTAHSADRAAKHLAKRQMQQLRELRMFERLQKSRQRKANKANKRHNSSNGNSDNDIQSKIERDSGSGSDQSEECSEDDMAEMNRLTGDSTVRSDELSGVIPAGLLAILHDLWSPVWWHSQLSCVDILFMTPQVFVNVLTHRFARVRDFALIVFDEVHHATGDSPYAQIIQHIQNEKRNWQRQYEFARTVAAPRGSSSSSQSSLLPWSTCSWTLPKLFSMSASPMSGGVGPTNSREVMILKIHDAVRLLEMTLDSRAVTASNHEEIEQFVGQPKERVLLYSSQSDLIVALSIKRIRHEFPEICANEKYWPVIETLVQELGWFFGAMACGVLCRFRQQRSNHKQTHALQSILNGQDVSGAPEQQKQTEKKEPEEKSRGNCSPAPVIDRSTERSQSRQSAAPAKSARNGGLQRFRIFRLFCEACASLIHHLPLTGLDGLNQLIGAGIISAKVATLIHAMHNQFQATQTTRANSHSHSHQQHQQLPSCMIFAERRVTVYVVAALLATLPFLRDCGVRAHAFLGHGLQSGIDEGMSSLEQAHVVEYFRSGAVNVLVSTNVGEEGLDIRSCNLVVMFDPFNNIIQYIQSRGRARQKHSEYLMFVGNTDERMKAMAQAAPQWLQCLKECFRQRAQHEQHNQTQMPRQVQTATPNATATITQPNSSIASDMTIGVSCRNIGNGSESVVGSGFWDDKYEFLDIPMSGPAAMQIRRMPSRRKGREDPFAASLINPSTSFAMQSHLAAKALLSSFSPHVHAGLLPHSQSTANAAESSSAFVWLEEQTFCLSSALPFNFISEQSAIAIVYRFCALTAADDPYAQKAPIWREHKCSSPDLPLTLYSCDVILPMSTGIAQMTGRPQRSKDGARSSVCLDVVRLLTARSLLDAHLLPITLNADFHSNVAERFIHARSAETLKVLEELRSVRLVRVNVEVHRQQHAHEHGFVHKCNQLPHGTNADQVTDDEFPLQEQDAGECEDESEADMEQRNDSKTDSFVRASAMNANSDKNAFEARQLFVYALSVHPNRDAKSRQEATSRSSTNPSWLSLCVLLDCALDDDLLAQNLNIFLPDLTGEAESLIAIHPFASPVCLNNVELSHVCQFTCLVIQFLWHSKLAVADQMKSEDVKPWQKLQAQLADNHENKQNTNGLFFLAPIAMQTAPTASSPSSTNLVVDWQRLYVLAQCYHRMQTRSIRKQNSAQPIQANTDSSSTTQEAFSSSSSSAPLFASGHVHVNANANANECVESVGWPFFSCERLIHGVNSRNIQMIYLKHVASIAFIDSDQPRIMHAEQRTPFNKGTALMENDLMQQQRILFPSAASISETHTHKNVNSATLIQTPATPAKGDAAARLDATPCTDQVSACPSATSERSSSARCRAPISAENPTMTSNYFDYYSSRWQIALSQSERFFPVRTNFGYNERDFLRANMAKLHKNTETIPTTSQSPGTHGRSISAPSTVYPLAADGRRIQTFSSVLMPESCMEALPWSSSDSYSAIILAAFIWKTYNWRMSSAFTKKCPPIQKRMQNAQHTSKTLQLWAPAGLPSPTSLALTPAFASSRTSFLFGVFCAMVSRGALLDVDYERYEFVGDSFLKLKAAWDLFRFFGNDPESVLHLRRARAVNNRNLALKGIRRQLHSHLVHYQFLGRSKHTLAKHSRRMVHPLLDEQFRGEFTEKAVADVVEALLGALIVNTNQAAHPCKHSLHKHTAGIGHCERIQHILRAAEQQANNKSTPSPSPSSALPSVLGFCPPSSVASVVLCFCDMCSAFRSRQGSALDFLQWMEYTLADYSVTPHDTSHKEEDTNLLQSEAHVPLAAPDELVDGATAASLNVPPSWQLPADLHALSRRLFPHYRFRFPILLLTAFAHSSIDIEEAKSLLIQRSYERLEFLGDALLDFVVTDHLYHQHAHISAGRMSLIRSAIVCNDALARLSLHWKLYEHLRHSNSALSAAIRHDVEQVWQPATEKIRQQINEKRGKSESSVADLLELGDVFVSAATDIASAELFHQQNSYCKVLGDLVESLVGAVFVDTGFDLPLTKHLIWPLIAPNVAAVESDFNAVENGAAPLHLYPVSQINELAGKRRCKQVKARKLDFMAPDWDETECHSPVFAVYYTIHDVAISVAVSKTADAAKERAAYRALRFLRNIQSSQFQIHLQPRHGPSVVSPQENEEKKSEDDADDDRNESGEMLNGEDETVAADIARTGHYSQVLTGMLLECMADEQDLHIPHSSTVNPTHSAGAAHSLQSLAETATQEKATENRIANHASLPQDQRIDIKALLNVINAPIHALATKLLDSVAQNHDSNSATQYKTPMHNYNQSRTDGESTLDSQSSASLSSVHLLSGAELRAWLSSLRGLSCSLCAQDAQSDFDVRRLRQVHFR